jgi:hypothetical protein
MAVFTAVGFDVAAPVLPVAPELPEMATGDDVAIALAPPVCPVLVELDWALAAPELPERATGLAVTRAPPPEPPLAELTDTLDPPLAEPPPVLVAAPPAPEVPVAVPPPPPLPPTAVTVTEFDALPVLPEPALELLEAPELATALDEPTAVAAPVFPELPELPDVAWAPAVADPKRRKASTLNAPATSERQTLVMDREFESFMFFTSSRSPGRWAHAGSIRSGALRSEAGKVTKMRGRTWRTER